ncbi:hypothetical protein [Pseudonocardia spinosispora]|uniref:hypothetical protein n=1 Tax=Pseudonocardia spinosispora TaxID=103441 RepID=UPI00041D653F|nr:hypothetical protein [Pseudonocardia spinosispora]
MAAAGVFLLLGGCADQRSNAVAPAGTQRVEVHYSAGEVQGGVQRVRVQRGGVVELVVSSDVADEVHLHTYDRKVDVPAGGSATLNFTADQSGVFEAELESRGVQLVQFEVR